MRANVCVCTNEQVQQQSFGPGWVEAPTTLRNSTNIRLNFWAIRTMMNRYRTMNKLCYAYAPHSIQLLVYRAMLTAIMRRDYSVRAVAIYPLQTPVFIRTQHNMYIQLHNRSEMA